MARRNATLWMMGCLGFMVLAFQNCNNKVNFNPLADDNKFTEVQALSCTVGEDGPTEMQTYPTQCLTDPGLPADSVGFEMNELENGAITLDANSPVTGTINGVNLYIEIATYEAPDTIVISAVSTTGKTTQLLNICNYSTATYGDPTTGTIRPPSDTILQFNVWLPAETASLQISVDQDVTYDPGTPTYIGIWNLNEFSSSIPKVPTSGLGIVGSGYDFRPQPAPLKHYNDHADTNNPSYPNYCVGAP